MIPSCIQSHIMSCYLLLSLQICIAKRFAQAKPQRAAIIFSGVRYRRAVPALHRSVRHCRSLYLSNSQGSITKKDGGLHCRHEVHRSSEAKLRCSMALGSRLLAVRAGCSFCGAVPPGDCLAVVGHTRVRDPGRNRRLLMLWNHVCHVSLSSCRLFVVTTWYVLRCGRTFSA